MGQMTEMSQRKRNGVQEILREYKHWRNKVTSGYNSHHIGSKRCLCKSFFCLGTKTICTRVGSIVL